MCRFFKKILFLFVFYSFRCLVFSQPIDTVRITGAFNESLSDFLGEIQQKYNLNFFYNTKWFNNKNIQKNYRDSDIKLVLVDVIGDLPYKLYFIQPNIYIFLPSDEVTKVLSQSAFQSDNTNDDIQVIGKLEDIGKVAKPEIKGIVIDGKTGEPIIGATIGVQNTTLGGSSDIKGKYYLALSPGIYNLIVSSVGYESKNINVKLIGNGNLDIELFEHTIKLDEVIVMAKNTDRNVKDNQMSLIELDKKTLKQLPSFIGVKDVIKGMTMMPGVSSVGEFGSGINVRGGGSDQNLFLMEGAPIFNSSHVFGLISVINPDAISNVTLYKGYIPQNFGERISSVMDIQMKEGNLNSFHLNGGISLLESHLTAETPLIKEKASLTLSARTSYSDWLLHKMPDMNLRKSNANFYDLSGLISILPNTKNKIALFGYISNDNFKYADLIRYNFTNILASMIWDHKFSDRLTSKIILAHSSYSINRDAIDIVTEKNRVTTGIKYNSLKLDFNYGFLSSHTLNYGAQIIYYSNNPGSQSPLDTISTILDKSIHKEQALESSLFLGDKYNITDNLSIQAGIRLSYYAYLGPNEIVEYREGEPKTENSVVEIKEYESGIIQKYLNYEPRFALKLLLNKTSSLKLSYNRNVQNINLVSYSSNQTPEDIWKLSSNQIRPSTVDQFALGFFKNFLNNEYETSVELYYKKLSNLIEYKNGTQISMNQYLEADLINASGKNYGFEFLFKKNSGTINGWISYTYSRSIKKTNSILPEEQINQNREYPSAFDRPHDLIINITYHYNKRIRANLNYNYATGRPVTLPEQTFTLNGQKYTQFSDRNKYRLFNYKRLDLSVSLDESIKRRKKWKGSWTLSVINVLANQNIYSVIYNSDGLYKMLIINQPIPTITYNFIF